MQIKGYKTTKKKMKSKAKKGLRLDRLQRWLCMQILRNCRLFHLLSDGSKYFPFSVMPLNTQTKRWLCLNLDPANVDQTFWIRNLLLDYSKRSDVEILLKCLHSFIYLRLFLRRNYMCIYYITYKNVYYQNVHIRLGNLIKIYLSSELYVLRFITEYLLPLHVSFSRKKKVSFI